MKPVTIDPTYYEDLQGLPFTLSQVRSLRHLISVMHTAHVVSEHIGVRMKRLKLSDQTILEMIALHYFSHSLHCAEAVYNLCLKGYGPAACMLTRPMLETFINFAYLWLCKNINGNDAERLAWLEYEDIEKDKICRMTAEEQLRRVRYALPEKESPFSPEFAEEMSQHAAAFKQKYGRSDWAIVKSLDARAQAVDRVGRLRELTGSSIMLEGLYNQCYKWTSQSIHGNSSASSMYATATDESIVITSRPTTGISEAAGMAAHFLMYVTCLADHVLHTDIDLNAQLDASGLRTDLEENS